MESNESISAAIRSIPAKMDALRRAFELLHGRTTITLRWADLRPHFDSLHSSVESRFRQLQSSSPAAASAAESAKPTHNPAPKPDRKRSMSPAAADSRASVAAVKKEVDKGGDESAAATVAVTPSPVLKELCERMDAAGLREYIVGKKDDILSEEVVAALHCAPDPAKLALDALEVLFASLKLSKDEVIGIRRVCLFLLEKLAALPPEVRAKGRNRALALAKLSLERAAKNKHNVLESKAFLLLVSTFDLFSAFGWNALCDYVIDKVSRKKQIIDLCRKVFPVELASDLVEKLSSKGYQLDALYFAYAFGVEDKFSVVTLLNAYLDEIKNQSVKTLLREGNATMNKNEAIAKEASSIRAVIKFVDDHYLASKLPSTLSSEYLGKKILEVESQKSGKKRPARINHSPKKRQTLAASSSVVGVLQAAPHMNLLLQQQRQPVVGLVDHVPAYLPHAGDWPYRVAAGPAMASLGVLGRGPSSLGISQTGSHYPSEQYYPSVAGLNERAVNIPGGLNPPYSFFP